MSTILLAAGCDMSEQMIENLPEIETGQALPDYLDRVEISDQDQIKDIEGFVLRRGGEYVTIPIVNWNGQFDEQQVPGQFRTELSRICPLGYQVVDVRPIDVSGNARMTATC